MTTSLIRSHAVVPTLTIAGLGLALVNFWNVGSATAQTSGRRAIEQEIVRILSQQSPSPITAVNCPDPGKPAVGKAFDCQVKIAEGAFPAAVTFTDADGGFRVRTKNILVMPVLEKQLVESVKRVNKLDVRVNCGSSRIKFFKQIGESFVCNLTQTNGKSGTATLTVTSLEGKVDAKWRIQP